MTQYRLFVRPSAEIDVEAVFDWYERQRDELGLEFLEELAAAYERVVENPLLYQDLKFGIRRVLLRRFPYAAYFAIDGEAIVILTVLHASRDPEIWQLRSGIPIHDSGAASTGPDV